MKIKIIAALLCLSLGVSTLELPKDGFGVKYDGGTIANLKSGTDVRIIPAGKTITLV